MKLFIYFGFVAIVYAHGRVFRWWPTHSVRQVGFTYFPEDHTKRVRGWAIRWHAR